MEIAFFGAGFMGYGIALNLLKNGHSVRVIAHRNRERVEKLATRGAREKQDYPDLFDGAEAVVSCVATASQLETIVDQARPHLQSVSLWIDCTTSRPEVAENMGALLKVQGVDFVDAPVTRGPKDAEKGQLVSLVGAEPQLYQRALPLIKCYSESITRLGPLGAGLRAKLINNFITMGQVALVTEAMRAADQAGIDRRELYDILIQGAANSGTIRKMVPPALDGDFSGHAFSLGNGAKDVRYSKEMHVEVESGRILAEALDEYYRLQLEKHEDNILLSELLRPE